MELPVIKLYHENGVNHKLNTTINADDILCFHYDKPDIVIHTLDGAFRPPMGMLEWFNYFQTRGFTKLSRDVVVNITKIVRFDPQKSKGYFANGLAVSVEEKNIHLLDFLYK